MKAAIYARVSTLDQEPENQLQELRRYVEARGWLPTEYVDRGASGAKDRRPALDQLLAEAKRRRFDVLVCWRLDRLGRHTREAIAASNVRTSEGHPRSAEAAELIRSSPGPSDDPNAARPMTSIDA